jgi:uncharacterized membrane protein
MEMRLFLQAILADTVALVSGIGSVILPILGITAFFNKPTPRWIVLVVAAICFTYAAARVWTTEHRARVAAEQKLYELTVPILTGEIDGVTAAPTGQGGQGSMVTCY